MIPHVSMTSMIASADSLVQFKNEVRMVSYLPLAHIFERFNFNFVCFKQGKYGIFNGDVFKLKDDLQLIKPTIFGSVPRLFNRMFDKMMAGINSQTGIKKKLALAAITTKLTNLKKNC